MDGEPDVAVRGQVVRERALDEEEIGARLEPLEAEGNLVLADAQLQRSAFVAQQARVRVGVEQPRGSAAEIGHQAEVDPSEQRALEDGSRAPHQELVVLRDAVVEEEAAIRLEVAPDLELVLAVRGAQVEAVVPAREQRRLGIRSLALLLQSLDALLLFVDRSPQIIELVRVRGSRNSPAHGDDADDGRSRSLRFHGFSSILQMCVCAHAADVALQGPCPRAGDAQRAARPTWVPKPSNLTRSFAGESRSVLFSGSWRSRLPCCSRLGAR